MKKLEYIITLIIVMSITGCSDFLDLQPKSKVPGETLFSDPEGVKLYMANLYYQLPIEDFTYIPAKGFNSNTGDLLTTSIVAATYTDEACNSERTIGAGGASQWWVAGYKLNRDLNLLTAMIPTLDITEKERENLIGESSFIRAYIYFALVKRYGGVSIIKDVQEYNGDIESLKVPRSTEKDTWDFVLEECDKAIKCLPESWDGGQRRATKWAALALKSRAALHAASIAKYWDKAPLSGDAVDQKLVGIARSEANRYYEASIKAAEAIINSGVFSLYKAEPENTEAAAENYRQLFEDPNNAPSEAIFIKGYALPGAGKSHNYDIWFNPNQTSFGWPHPGRMCPALDLVDVYESYGSNGESTPIVTTEDGNIEDYNGFNKQSRYLRFDSPTDIFSNKDARLFATMILPFTKWKDQTIIIQAGLVKPDGEALIEVKNKYEHNGVVYHTYGAEAVLQYSGFDTYGGNMTRTGFGFKKFLNEKINVTPAWNNSITDFMDMRYAEVLLNYAEAVVESGYTDGNAHEKATKALNDIRKRAGHKDIIPLTLEHVLRERQVELSFENKRNWDLLRRREFHEKFNNRRLKALLPLLDLRGDKPQYIFVRRYVSRLDQVTFDPKNYYLEIPGVNTTGLVQNPQY